MKRFPSAAFLLFFSCIITVLSGCGTTEQTRFYLLESLAEQSAAPSGIPDGEIVLGIGPVKLPDYLEHPQIVTRSGPKLNLAEFDRWAEPLEQSFARVLSENLSNLLGTDRVIFYPWEKSVAVQYQVRVDVSRFYGESGRAVLDAKWSVSKGGKMITVRHGVVEKPVASTGFEALVLAQSQCVTELSKSIAEAIRTDLDQAR